MFCQKCGKESATGDSVCAACGQRVGQPPPVKKEIGEYGGIGRLGYWIGSVLVLCIGGLLLCRRARSPSVWHGRGNHRNSAHGNHVPEVEEHWVEWMVGTA